MVAIKLWATAGACSLAPHILLNELGIQYDAVVLELKDGITEDIKRLNPKKKVPVLEFDNQIITETIAIFTMIAQLAPERNLLGKSDLERVRVYEYLAYLSGTVHGQGYGGLFRPGRYSDDVSVHESIQKKSMITLMECYDYIEAGLQGLHAVGDQLTVVDPYLYVFWRWGAPRIPDMHTRFPKYAALVKELGKLDSMRRTLEQEGIESFLVDGTSL